MFTVWQLLADFRAGRTISLVKSHATLCFASYSAWQTMITRSHDDITLLWCRIQSSSGIENNKFVYGLQNWFVFVAAFIPDYTTLLLTVKLSCLTMKARCWSSMQRNQSESFRYGSNGGGLARDSVTTSGRQSRLKKVPHGSTGFTDSGDSGSVVLWRTWCDLFFL